MAKKATSSKIKTREEALEDAFDKIIKAHGEGSLMKLGEKQIQEIEAISTGSYTLNEALGIGGVPRGRIIEIFGAESSGKTTLALHIVAQAQKNKGIAAFIDAEHALDPVYAKALGVDVDQLLISQPDNGEQALEIAELLVQSHAVDVIVIDSVAALVPKQEIDGLMSDQQMGLQARLMSKALRKLTGLVSKANTTLIFINQIREKIGGMPSYGGIPQTTTSGGRALKFFSSVRMEVKRIGSIKATGDEVIGNEVVVKVVKNKVAPPFKEAKFPVVFGKGIDSVLELLLIAENRKVISKAGSWYSYQDIKAQGIVKFRDEVEQNPEIIKSLEIELYGKNDEEVVEEKETSKKKTTKKTSKKSSKKSDDELETLEIDEDNLDIDLDDIEE